LESGKSFQEIEAPATGTLKILKSPGEVYQVGTVLGEIM
jgi:pyruvate/2-oxoglutarate dehydrogenase complex dihydrolipoamide acyltransferase (E2) component